MFAHWNSKYYASMVNLGLEATLKVDNFAHF